MYLMRVVKVFHEGWHSWNWHFRDLPCMRGFSLGLNITEHFREGFRFSWLPNSGSEIGTSFIWILATMSVRCNGKNYNSIVICLSRAVTPTCHNSLIFPLFSSHYTSILSLARPGPPARPAPGPPMNFTERAWAEILKPAKFFLARARPEMLFLFVLH
jgi:hypothetical protein